MATILAVDDSRTVLDLISSTLKRSGHTVVTAEDGAQGVEKARAQKFDLILSDVNMPNMGGTAMVIRLRRLSDYQNTPILMVTTEGSGFKKDNAKKAGANGWLQKPFDPQKLTDIVSSFL